MDQVLAGEYQSGGMRLGVGRHLSLAEEWAEIYRMIEMLSRRPWPAVLAGLCRAREILLTAVPEAAERGRKASELGYSVERRTKAPRRDLRHYTYRGPLHTGR